ncbi:enoyl-CoA hydratase/isomerase [Paenibacillus sp. 1001270B_150601_E10]|uniref:enoyl-CoA hydratase/isomerase n=1 Tax=Paenibacillus sp. 1001270B_150601_E10 TaxID=2787079 RepID=UPI00189DEDD8|nr:enoyl-CoA hydratase/isomerase [Paenibacillus sp. 1001270B_150601_E10]
MNRIFETIRVREQGPVAYLQLNRKEANNSINGRMIDECTAALSRLEPHIQVVVLEGLPEVFCSGADFSQVHEQHERGDASLDVAEDLYTLWERLSSGPYITIAHVKGKVNAGGVGFVAACDIVIAELEAQFSLSEMLFGLFPACVLPFLIRRIGYQRSHYMTMSTQAISGQLAYEWGLVDAVGADSSLLLRKHLPRLTRISKDAILQYKAYLAELQLDLSSMKSKAVRANLMMFSNPQNRERISRYETTGLFPWEH